MANFPPAALPARFVVVRLLAALALVAPPVLANAAVTAAPASAHPHDEPTEEPAVREMVFPVVGPVNYTDTWGACRGVRCSRSHKGADLFGPKLAPLVASADGVVTSVRRTAATTAGNKIIIEDDDGWRYVYFHLNNDTPGTDDGANPQGWIIADRLQVGDRVEAGDVVGYLGDSGNAERTPNHLHFELHKPNVGAINPTPSLDAAFDAGRVVPAALLASTAVGRAEHEPTIVAWYNALLGRPPSETELFAWSDRFDVDLGDRNDLIADLTMAPERARPAGTTLRAFQVALGRRPELGELRQTVALSSGGADHVEVVRELLDGDAFAAKYGTLSDADFIETIYRNARGRSPSSSVRAYWTGQLGGGRDRAEMAGYFVDSYGLKNRMWHDLEVVQAYRAALDRLPTEEEFDRWVAHLDDGGLIFEVVASIRE
ncbi:MAG: DUF4214 domain-containing protein [Acidimicrobiales bacterium]